MDAYAMHEAAQVVATLKRKPVEKIKVETGEFESVTQWVLAPEDIEFVAFAGVWAEAKAKRQKLDAQSFKPDVNDPDGAILANMSQADRVAKWPVWSDELESYWKQIVQTSGKLFYDFAPED